MEEKRFSNKSNEDFHERHSDTNTKVCYFYSKYNNCKFGDNCRLLHQVERPILQRSKYEAVGFNRPQISSKHTYDKHSENINFKKSTARRNEFDSKRFYDEGRKHRHTRPCRYFQAGHCEKGVNCIYNHFSNELAPVPSSSSSPKRAQTKRNIFTNSNYKTANRVCHYFQMGTCFRGEICRYSHDQKYAKETPRFANNVKSNEFFPDDDSNVVQQQVDNIESEVLDLSKSFSESKIHDMKNKNDLNDCKKIQNTCGSSSIKSTEENNLYSMNVVRNEDEKFHIPIHKEAISHSVGLKIYGTSSLSDTEIFQLRNTEIMQFKKRFPKCELEQNDCYVCIIHPTDPDWPFDVCDLHLKVNFPEKYPVEICSISVIQGPEYIIESLLRFLNEKILEWLKSRHEYLMKQQQVELIFRPFLKWFDKNLIQLFHSGLKKDREKNNYDNHDENSKSSASENVKEFGESESPVCIPSDAGTSYEASKQELSPSKSNTFVTSLNNGIKVLFTGLELVEGAAALSCARLSLSLHCSRCKTPFEIKSIPNKNISKPCSKCNRRLECNFNPSVMHQFSNVVGNIHLVDCIAVDVNLVECAFMVDCLNCSKQVQVDGVHYGQKQKLWCKLCNQKLIIGVQGVKFQGAAILSNAKPSATKKVEKKKDPLIKEGNALPDFGTCKHYKKSYRWLRFPCCGKLYPCDICHDEAENGHEMKFANRMICGYCSKEQPYSKDKACFNCSGSMIARRSAHWEGGKGCTNQVKMARNDKQKFAGKIKTVSKKAQGEKKKK